MASFHLLTAFLILLCCNAFSQSLTTPRHHLIKQVISRKIPVDDDVYCESWKFSVENNDAGAWSAVPERCLDFMKGYMLRGRYKMDSHVVANDALSFAKTVNVSGNGTDAWVFDIDETLLSNLPYYEDHGFGSERFNETSFDEWAELGVAPALPASLMLYNELKSMGFTLILLTGRSESQRNATEKNLIDVGFTGWERLILRGSSDSGTTAIVYKSKKRKEVQSEGYTIQGNSGDQWSDLDGYAISRRSFKLPNPMYFIA